MFSRLPDKLNRSTKLLGLSLDLTIHDLVPVPAPMYSYSKTPPGLFYCIIGFDRRYFKLAGGNTIRAVRQPSEANIYISYGCALQVDK